MIGDPAVRNRGTIGGSIANDDPAADYPAACSRLNAIIVTNQRKIPAAEFFKGLYETALEPGEIIVRVAFKPPSRAAYMKFRNPASRFALVGVFVAKKGFRYPRRGDRRRQSGRLPLASGGGGARQALQSEIARGAQDGRRMMNADIHASPDYRAHLVARDDATGRGQGVRKIGLGAQTAKQARTAAIRPQSESASSLFTSWRRREKRSVADIIERALELSMPAKREVSRPRRLRACRKRPTSISKP